MPLILAIEPDRRQANQLTTVVKSRLHADLVLAESAARALAALGDRVPDLILTSALLSPTDEVVLGERLRALDGAAAHVQTLTIPVLASAKPRSRTRAGGMLSALRRAKPSDDVASEGCDPTVFASQCAEYLERAVAEHAINLTAAQQKAEAIADVEPAVNEPIAHTADSFDDGFTTRLESSGEPVQAIREWVEEIPEPVEPIAEPIVYVEDPAAAPPALSARPSTSSGRAVEGFAAAVEPGELREPDEPREPLGPVVPLYMPQPVFIDAPAATATVQEAIAQIEAFVAREALAAETIAKIEADQSVEEVDEIVELDTPDDEARTAPERTDDPDVPEGFIELDMSTWLEDAASVESVTASAPAEAVTYESTEFEDDDVYDINAIDEDPLAQTLAMISRQERHDRQQRRDAAQDGIPHPATPPASPAESPESPSSLAAFEEHRAIIAAHTASPRAQARHKPIQDEWGFFDPEQCGFAALLAKLDEILETDDRSA